MKPWKAATLRDLAAELVEMGARPSEAMGLAFFVAATVDLASGDRVAWADAHGLTRSTYYRFERRLRVLAGAEPDGRRSRAVLG